MTEELTCASCRHSEDVGIDNRKGDMRPLLWCDLRNNFAEKRCDDYSYEPGADEQEREA